MGRSGRWLAEGIASYYQNISRARAGHMSQKEAWQKLHAGFGRGRKDSGSQTLRQANRNLGKQGGYMRVYWTGAAIALLADVDLRRQSGGRQSLDLVLDEFAACHLPSEKMWKVEEFLATLDQIGKTDVFTRLYDRYVDNPRFPDLDNAYAYLGLSSSRKGKLRLGDGASGVTVRNAMTAPRDNRQRIASCPTSTTPVS
jgi:predicted metalloprotease with PDZ domain